MTMPKQVSIDLEVAGVINCLVLSERHVEFAALIEAATTVETGAIKIVEELSRLRILRAVFFDKLIEALAMRIEEFRVVTGFDLQRKSASKLFVEINEMRIQVIQERALRFQPQRHSQPATERLDVTTLCVLPPERVDVWNQPTLSASPL